MTRGKIHNGEGPFRRKPAAETECAFFTGLSETERVRADHVGHKLGHRQAGHLMTFIANQEPPLQGSALIRAIVEAISTLTSRMLVEAVAPECIGEVLDLINKRTRTRTRCGRFRPAAPGSRPPAGRAHQRPTRAPGRPARGPAESTRRHTGCRRPLGPGGTR